jgi:hypothetical protein
VRKESRDVEYLFFVISVIPELHHLDCLFLVTESARGKRSRVRQYATTI